MLPILRIKKNTTFTEVILMDINNIEGLYKVIEILKKKVSNLEEKTKEYDQYIEQQKKEIKYLKDTNTMLLKLVTTFKEKMDIIGLLHNWFMNSSEEYKCYDIEIIQELSRKYHLNVTTEPILLPTKKNPYHQIIKYCFEEKVDFLYRNEIQRYFNVKSKTSIRIMKRIVQEDPTLFELRQKSKHGRNSMYYLQVISLERLKERYYKLF